MTLGKTYLFWSLGLLISIFMGTAYYITAMHHIYGNISGNEDFDGLPYFIYALLIVVFSTGILSGVFTYLTNKKTLRAKQLSISLVSFHTISAVLALATFSFAFIYLNIPGLIIFSLLPYFAWQFTTDKGSRKRWIYIFSLAVILILISGALFFYSLVLSDPYTTYKSYGN
jgi:hypothetical protein